MTYLLIVFSTVVISLNIRQGETCQFSSGCLERAKTESWAVSLILGFLIINSKVQIFDLNLSFPMIILLIWVIFCVGKVLFLMLFFKIPKYINFFELKESDRQSPGFPTKIMMLYLLLLPIFMKNPSLSPLKTFFPSHLWMFHMILMGFWKWFRRTKAPEKFW